MQKKNKDQFLRFVPHSYLGRRENGSGQAEELPLSNRQRLSSFVKLSFQPSEPFNGRHQITEKYNALKIRQSNLLGSKQSVSIFSKRISMSSERERGKDAFLRRWKDKKMSSIWWDSNPTLFGYEARSLWHCLNDYTRSKMSLSHNKKTERRKAFQLVLPDKSCDLLVLARL